MTRAAALLPRSTVLGVDVTFLKHRLVYALLSAPLAHGELDEDPAAAAAAAGRFAGPRRDECVAWDLAALPPARASAHPAVPGLFAIPGALGCAAARAAVVDATRALTRGHRVQGRAGEPTLAGRDARRPSLGGGALVVSRPRPRPLAMVFASKRARHVRHV